MVGLVVLGAVIGGPLRYAAGHYLDGALHRGTLLANVLGSFLLGLFTGLDLSPSWLVLLGTGFCGSFTTYSSFAVQSYSRGARNGTVYVVLTLSLSLAAAFLGFALA